MRSFGEEHGLALADVRGAWSLGNSSVSLGAVGIVSRPEDGRTSPDLHSPAPGSILRTSAALRARR